MDERFEITEKNEEVEVEFLCDDCVMKFAFNKSGIDLLWGSNEADLICNLLSSMLFEN